MTSAGGESEGISWVDVAASAAGIYRQMEEIGRQAASGFTATFNQAAAAALQSGSRSTFHGAGTRAGASFGEGAETAMVASVAQMAGRIVPGLDRVIEKFQEVGHAAGHHGANELNQSFMRELDAGMAAAGPVFEEKIAKSMAFNSAGTRGGQMFTQGFTGQVAAGLQTLGAVSTENLERSLGAAGVRGSEQFMRELSEGFAAGLTTLGGASLEQAVTRVMNGLAVHGGEIFARGLENRISAGIQVFGGAGDPVANLTASIGAAGRTAGSLWSKEFVQNMEQGLATLGVAVMPSFEQFRESLRSTGMNVSTDAAQMTAEFFRRQFEQMAHSAVPNVGVIAQELKRAGMEGEADIAAMAGKVNAELHEMAVVAKSDIDTVRTSMSLVGLEGAEFETVIQGFLAKIENAVKPGYQNLVRAASDMSTEGAGVLVGQFSAEVNRLMAGGMAIPEALRGAFSKFGAEEAGEAAAGQLAGSFLDKLATRIHPGLGTVMEKAKTGLTALGGEAGLAGGMAIAGGIAAAVVGGAALIESAMKNWLELVNKEFEAFGEAGSHAASAMLGAFKSVVEGEMPDVGAVVSAGLGGIQTAMELPLNSMNAAIDTTVGHIPILGSMIKTVTGEAQQVLGAMFAAMQEYTSIAGEFGNIILDIGNKWAASARDIAGQTLGSDRLHDYLEIVRDIAASGDLVHFKDVADTVGELGQRLSFLDNGLGLSHDQLTELTRTLAEGNEILFDTRINIDNLTAAFNSFNIPAEQTSEQLHTLVNIARMTGADINELTRDIDSMSPAFQAMGFSLEQSALMMGLINQELGKPALARFSFAMARLPEELHKSEMSLDDFVGILQAYVKSGRDMDAIDFAQPFLGSAKAAENYVHAVKQGIPLTVEAAEEAERKLGPKLKEPWEEALEATKAFEHTLEQLSNQVQAALAPLGMGLVEKLNGIGDKLGNWMQQHQAEFTGFVGGIGEKLLQWGGTMSHFLATMMRDMSGSVEFFKDALVVSVAMADVAVGKMAGILAMVPGDPMGMRGVADAAKAALPALKGLWDFDVKKLFNEGADAADALGYKLEGLEGPLAKLISESQDAASMWESFRATFGKPLLDAHSNPITDATGAIQREAPKLQDALSGSLEGGLKIDPSAIAEVTDQLKQKGIEVEIDPDGKVKKFAAHTQKEMDDLQEYLNTRFGKDKFPDLAKNVTFVVQELPKETVQQFLQNKIGVPSELAGSDGIHAKLFVDWQNMPEGVRQLLGGAPGTAGGPAASTGVPPPSTPSGPRPPQPWGWLSEHSNDFSSLVQLGGAALSGPAMLPMLLLDLLSGTGFAQGGTVAGGRGGVDDVPGLLTAGEKVMTVQASQQFGPILDAMNSGTGLQRFAEGGDVVGAAGIPRNLQSGMTGGSIVLPAGIRVMTPQPMGEADTMTRAGVPGQYQGDVISGGVTLPGVALPTNLDMRDVGRKSTEDVMSALGIPLRNQTSDAVVLDVKFNVKPGGSTLDMGGAGAGVGAAAGVGGTGTADLASFTNPGSVGAWQPAVQAALLQRGGSVGYQRGGLVGMKYGGMAGIPQEAYPAWESAIMTQIRTESGGDPNIKASDPNDPNVKAGIPSRGLLQYTPGTYAAHNPTGLPYPDPYGQIAATLFYAPHDGRGFPAHGQSRSIGEGHGFQTGGVVGMLPGGPLPLSPEPGGKFEDWIIGQACIAEGVDPHVWMNPLKTLIGRESGGQQFGWWEPGVTQHGYVDVNTGGNEAVGVAQVTPQTAAGVGMSPNALTQPLQNIRASIRYIMQRYSGPNAPGRGHGGLGKNLPPDQAIFDVQQADPGMPPMGYQGGGGVGPLFSDEGPDLYGAAYAHNREFASGQGFRTQLSPGQEAAFRRWVRDNNVPFDPDAHISDYDMRGYWQATGGGKGWHPGAHFPDTWKTPFDTSFSGESMYAKPGTPFVWQGDKLVDTRDGSSIFGHAEGGLLRGPHAGVKASLSYHSHPEHSILTHMQSGGMLAGLLKGITTELGFGISDEKGGDGKTFWERLLGKEPEGHQTGGYVQGSHLPGRDSVPMHLEAGTFVVNRARSAQHRDVLDRLMGSGGGAAATAGRTIPTILEVGERLVPPHIAIPNAGLLHAINSGNLLARNTGGGTGVLQVIYDDPGTGRKTGEAGGKLVGPGTSQPGYYGADWKDHHGHVHTSFATSPSGEPYGLPKGTDIRQGKSGFPAWVYALGNQFGLEASTYAGHQESSGQNRGIDWWPKGKSDMSGASYTPEERGRLQRFASTVATLGSRGGDAGSPAAWAGTARLGSSLAGAQYAGRTGSSGGLLAMLPSWLRRALGLGMEAGGEVGGDGEVHPQGGGFLGGGPGDDASDMPGDKPPPSWTDPARVQPGTPGGVETRFGWFRKPWDDPSGNYFGMKQEQAYKFGQWLEKQAKAAQTGVTDQENLNQALLEQQAAQIRLSAASDKLSTELGKMPAGLTAAQQEAWKRDEKNKGYQDAVKELTDATKASTAADKKVTTAKRAQADNVDQQNLDALSTSPWETGKKKETSPDENAAAMGEGLVKGVAQELGFGDVFAKPPWQWGLWKLFAGGASVGINLLNAMGEKSGGSGGLGGLGGADTNIFGGTGAAPGPGGAATGAAAPGAAADQGGGGIWGTFDPKDRSYTLPSGEKDIPDGSGGYAMPHGKDWKSHKAANGAVRYFAPGQEPKEPGEPGEHHPGGGGPEEDAWNKMLGPDEEWHLVAGGRQKFNTKTKQLIPGVYGANRQPVGAAPAPPPPQGGLQIPVPGANMPQPGRGPFSQPPGEAPPAIPGLPIPTAAPPATTDPRPPMMPGDQVLAEVGGEWVRMSKSEADRQGLNYHPVPGSGPGTSGPTAAGGSDWRYQGQTDFFGAAGGDGGAQSASFAGAGAMDWLMHPARTAMRQARAEGRMGPPPAGSVTPAMARSEAPANVPAAAAALAGHSTFVSVSTTNNGVLHGEDQAAKMLTGAQAKRSGFHPSMGPVIV